MNSPISFLSRRQKGAKTCCISDIFSLVARVYKIITEVLASNLREVLVMLLVILNMLL